MMKRLTKKDLQSHLYKPSGDVHIERQGNGQRLTVYRARDMVDIFQKGFIERFSVNQITPLYQYPCVMDISWKDTGATITPPPSFGGQSKGQELRSKASHYVVIERKTADSWAVYFACGVCWFRVMECEHEKHATWLAERLIDALVEFTSAMS